LLHQRVGDGTCDLRMWFPFHVQSLRCGTSIMVNTSLNSLAFGASTYGEGHRCPTRAMLVAYASTL
ncbi:hypothetical protein ACJX0J_036108, partial [Zea mays]